jgi:hypothetical protein
MAGMPRAGTTYMYYAFGAHPSIFLPYRKELAYFSANYAKGESWYHAFFEGASPGQFCADISPDYFLHPDAAVRIRRYCASTKVILAVRDPAAWAVSFHRHIATFHWKVPSFAAFLDSHPMPNNHLWPIARSSGPSFSIRDSLVQRTVERYRSTFGRDLLLFSFDIFKERPLTVLRSIESFLGLQSAFNSEDLPPGAINSAQRRHIKLLSYILSREELIALSSRIVPGVFLRTVRKRMHELSVPRGAARPDPRLAPDLALAGRLLSADREYVSSLFATSPIQLGDGSALR